MKSKKSAAVGLVICFVAMIAIVGTITFKNYNKKSDTELAKAEEENAEEQTQKDEVQSANTDKVEAEIVTEENLQEIDKVDAPVISHAPEYSFSEKDTLIWPVDGNVILNYSMDQTVYFATLDQYKYNPAVLIAGEVGMDVLAAADGEVTAIQTDAQTGTTITVNLGNGYEVVYGQLGEVNVSQGEKVSQGDSIGHLGAPTKYYSVEGCNLYFQMRKDGEPINPMDYITE